MTKDTLGSVIKKARKENNLTLREAAKRIGISHPYLSQLENGHNYNPNNYRLKKIAYELDIPYVYLVQLSNTEVSMETSDKIVKLSKKFSIDVYNHLNTLEDFTNYIECFLETYINEAEKTEDINELYRYFKFVDYQQRNLENAFEDTETIVEANDSDIYEIKFLVPAVQLAKKEVLRILPRPRLTKEKAKKQFLSIENILSMDEDIHFNGRILSKEEKEKALQILKMMLDK